MKLLLYLAVCLARCHYLDAETVPGCFDDQKNGAKAKDVVHCLEEAMEHFKPNKVQVAVMFSHINNPNIELDVLTTDLMITFHFETPMRGYVDYGLLNPTGGLPGPLLDYAVKPAVILANDKKAQYDMDKHAKFLLYSQKKDGKATMIVRLEFNIDCQFDFSFYPFDEHVCRIFFLSPLSASEINVTWNGTDSLSFHPNYGLHDYDIEDSKTDICDGGTPNCLVIRLKIARRLASYVFNTFVPTVFVVFLAWISFFLDPESTPARVSLGITSVLSLITLSLRQSLDVGYMTSLDAWFAMSLVFVSASLFEFAFINMQLKASSELRKTAKYMKIGSKQEDMIEEAVHLYSIALRVDFYMRRIFPAVFALFMIVFFIVNAACNQSTHSNMVSDKTYLGLIRMGDLHDHLPSGASDLKEVIELL